MIWTQWYQNLPVCLQLRPQKGTVAVSLPFRGFGEGGTAMECKSHDMSREILNSWKHFKLPLTQSY